LFSWGVAHMDFVQQTDGFASVGELQAHPEQGVALQV
jgi:hypothetical protein